MLKILDNYTHLTELWPMIRADAKDPTSVNRVIGVEAKMKEYNFLFGMLPTKIIKV